MYFKKSKIKTFITQKHRCTKQIVRYNLIITDDNYDDDLFNNNEKTI